MEQIIRAVFDTNIFLQAILSEGGPANACVKHVFAGSIRLIVTDSVLREINDVVTRPKLVSKYPILATERPRELIEKIISSALIVGDPWPIFKLGRDRNDEVFMNLAIENKANYLVTRDRDLLDLRDDSAFSSQFPNLKIVTPVGFLEIVRAT